MARDDSYLYLDRSTIDLTPWENIHTIPDNGQLIQMMFDRGGVNE